MNSPTHATLLAIGIATISSASAHTFHQHEPIPRITPLPTEIATLTGNRLVLEKRDGKLQALNAIPVTRIAAVDSTPLALRASFLDTLKSAFGAFPKLQTRSDGRYFYVESDGLPAHNMMIGITAWQQQVPVPQAYTGNNAWQIPLNPVPARYPMSTRNNFLRGAIALAVNGIPIFNPLNNRGVDAYRAGELDRWGGHCGRADDYHYHIAPVHLQPEVGRAQPIAWALDGYAIHGYTEADGSTVRNLDRLNGHTHGGAYHYHATKSYPYLNGGFHGEVREAGGQVDPQPRAAPLRPFTRPLRGARIVGFSGNLDKGYSLKYEVSGKPGYVNYKLAPDRSATFTYIDPNGRRRTESYSPRNRREDRDNRKGPPKRGKKRR